MSGLLESLKSMYAHDATVLAGIENGSVRGIPLTQGKIAIVDVEDYGWLIKFNWHSEKIRYTTYAKRNTWHSGKAGTMFMHREILGLKTRDGKIVDHKNRNGLDNRRNNIRIVPSALNSLNCKLHKDNSSGYRGVSWDKINKKWSARIKLKDSSLFLGRHLTAIDAARAFDIAAIKYRGENAILNFPREEYYHV